MSILIYSALSYTEPGRGDGVRIFGKGFNYGQDGPGNRLVYHLSGCNMHCIWCSNPEGMDGTAGKDRSIKSVADECESCRKLFFSGGGVTFTGGEATLQSAELLKLLKTLKKLGINTAIETNGTHEKLYELLPFIDYLIMDFKHYDSDTLKNFTGLGNENIKKNFERITASGRQLHIRIPLINGFNTEHPEGFAEYFSKFNTANTVFEFLPYHEYGKEKWKTEYKVKNGFITPETLELFKKTFSENGLKTIKT